MDFQLVCILFFIYILGWSSNKKIKISNRPPANFVPNYTKVMRVKFDDNSSVLQMVDISKKAAVIRYFTYISENIVNYRNL